jgi:hypothetical protein
VLVGVFTALEILCKENDIEGIKAIVDAVLNEAKSKK